MNKKSSLLLLASSALGYGLALVMSQWFWWTMFIFLAPVFYLGTKKNLSFKEGLFYGLIAWGIGISGIVYAIVDLGSGSLVLRLVPAIFILLFQVFFVGLWFFIATKLLSLTKITSPILRLLIWVTTTYLYFYWVTHYCLSLSHNWEGYFLMHPLLPLAEHIRLLSALPYVGKELLTILLLFTNAAWVIPMLSTRSLKWLVPVLGMVPWLASYTTAPKKQPAPPWLSKVAVVPQAYVTYKDLSPMAQTMGTSLKQVIDKHPAVELILLPEYALRIDLASIPELGTFWSEQRLGKPINLILGAYNWEGDKVYNASYWLYDGKIKQVFNKRHTMMLIEGVANWYNFDALKSLYHAALPPVSASTNNRTAIEVFPEVSFVPYICSELYFNNKPDDHYPESTIIALCKDTWSRAHYVHRLMYLGAKMKALEWQRPIIYVAYTYNGYCDATGYVTPLNTTN